MSTVLKFYGGVEGEVGGNIIEIYNKDVSLFLDFGVNYTLRRKYYDDILVKPKSITELINLGLIFPFPFLKESRRNYEVPHENFNIFISHAHSDHYKYISLVDRKVPIFSSKETFEIINTYSYLKKYKTFEENYENLRFNLFEKEKTIKIDNIEVLPLPVDHSIIGAYSFLVYTPEGSIFYSGDIRFHGPRNNLSYSTFEKLKNEKIDVAIVEATQITEMNILTESDVEVKLENILRSVGDSNVLIDISLYDLDRISTIFRVAKKLNKKIILSSKIAFFLLKLCPDILSSFAEDVFIMEGLRKTSKEFFISVLNEKLLSLKEINNLKNCILLFSHYSIEDLKEAEKLKPILYILSASEPHDEDREISFNRLKNWLEFYGIPLISLHSSGHADLLTLFNKLKEISPKLIIPVHTPNPFLARKVFERISKVILPKKAQSYHFEEIL